jgi:hypothetical protein
VSWHYRIIKHVAPHEEWCGLHEVYDIDGGISWTAEPVTFIGGTQEEIVAALRLALKDAETREVMINSPTTPGEEDENR